MSVGLRPAPRPQRSRDGLLTRFETWLVQTGTRASASQCLGGAVALVGVVFLVLAALTGPIVAAAPALACAAVPFLLLARHRRERMSAVQRAWPDALRDLLAGVAAGQSLHQALIVVSAQGPAPLRPVLQSYPGLSRALGPVGALEAMRRDLADPLSDRVIEVLVLALERGGSIVRTVLEDIVQATTADLDVLAAIETEVLESRINARAVLVLPWCALVLLTIGDGPFRDFYRGAGGAVVVVLGAVLSAVGALLIARLGGIPIEARVFDGGATG